jgi:hypothetical protein
VRFTVPPVTVAEVIDWWQASTSRGPLPSASSYKTQMRQFNAHRGYADSLLLRSHRHRRTADAVRAVLAECSRELRVFDHQTKRTDLIWPEINQVLAADEYDILNEARPVLLELRAVFAPSHRLPAPVESAWLAQAPHGDERLTRLRRLSERVFPPPGRRIRQPPLWEACGIVCWMIVRDACLEAGRIAGVGADSVTVAIAAQACRRLGFRGATKGELALRLKAHGFKTVKALGSGKFTNRP